MLVARKVVVGRYLVVTGIHTFFQIRIPKGLVACRVVPPVRVRLGALGRREARRRAEELAVLARRLFAERRKAMEGDVTGNIGSAEWLAGLKAHLADAAARLQEPPPPSPPLAAATQAAIGHLIEIEQELGKGPAANPIIIGNADRLRTTYHDRLRVLGSLSGALVAEAESDALYDKLSAFAGARPKPQAVNSTTPQGEITRRQVESPVIALEAPVAPAQEGAVRREAPPSGVSTVTSTAPKFSQVMEEYIAMRAGAGAEKGELDRLLGLY